MGRVAAKRVYRLPLRPAASEVIAFTSLTYPSWSTSRRRHPVADALVMKRVSSMPRLMDSASAVVPMALQADQLEMTVVGCANLIDTLTGTHPSSALIEMSCFLPSGTMMRWWSRSAVLPLLGGFVEGLGRLAVAMKGASDLRVSR